MQEQPASWAIWDRNAWVGQSSGSPKPGPCLQQQQQWVLCKENTQEWSLLPSIPVVPRIPSHWKGAIEGMSLFRPCNLCF